MHLRDLARLAEKLELLDPVGEWLSSTVSSLAGSGMIKDALSGTWLGHPVHPMLTDLPIGMWAGACALDVLGGEDVEDAADALIGLGILAAFPTAAAGLSDWSDTYGPDKRLGMVHATANSAALVLYSASLIARRSGSRRLGVALSWMAGGSVVAGGYLGGHLSYARGVNVNHTAFDEAPSTWTAAGRLDELEEGKPALASPGGYGVLLLRRGRTVHAIAARCSHAGGPLQEGEVDASLCVTCPWHGSRFSLRDGSVRRGPATSPQPVFDTRVRDGEVQVRVRPV